MTYRQFLDTRAKRLQLGAYSADELMAFMNDAISKIELNLYKHYGEAYFPTGLPANRCLLNLSHEVSMVKEVFLLDQLTNTLTTPFNLYYDMAQFMRDNSVLGEPGQPTNVLVANNLSIQQTGSAATAVALFEEFTADMFGGNTRMMLLFDKKPPTALSLRLLGKRGFSRIYRETDSNLLLTDWSDVLLASLRCVIAEDRNNWNDLKNLEQLLAVRIATLNRVAAQKDNEAIGGMNATS